MFLEDIKLRTWLKNLRMAKGLSAKALAAKVGVKQRAVFHWEAGTKSPGREKVSALAAVLGQEVHGYFDAEANATSEGAA